MRTLAAIFFCFVCVSPAYACVCEEFDIKKRFSDAEEVLFVRVVQTTLLTYEDSGQLGVRVEYEVIESFKSNDGASKTVEAKISSCAPTFIAGSTYILHIRSNRKVNRCTGSYMLDAWRPWGREELQTYRDMSL